jgi:hypothetical protein
VVDALLSKQKNSQLVFGLRVAEHHMLNALFFVVLNNQVQQFVDRAVNVELRLEQEHSTEVAGRVDRVELDSSRMHDEVKLRGLIVVFLRVNLQDGISDDCTGVCGEHKVGDDIGVGDHEVVREFKSD